MQLRVYRVMNYWFKNLINNLSPGKQRRPLPITMVHRKFVVSMYFKSVNCYTKKMYSPFYFRAINISKRILPITATHRTGTVFRDGGHRDRERGSQRSRQRWGKVVLQVARSAQPHKGSSRVWWERRRRVLASRDEAVPEEAWGNLWGHTNQCLHRCATGTPRTSFSPNAP